LLVSPSIQFRWLIIFALGSGRSVDGCPQSREACIRLRLQISEHLPIASLDLGKTFIGSRKHSPDKLDDLAPQGVELAAEPNFDDLPAQGVELGAQPLYFPLALFTASVEIAHAPPSYSTSFWNCSNSPRKFSGGPLVPSLITGVTV
jgi:hypothetical protein